MSTSASVDLNTGPPVLTVGSTAISGGTNGNVLTQAAGVLGESALSVLLDNLGGITGTF